MLNIQLTWYGLTNIILGPGKGFIVGNLKKSKYLINYNNYLKLIQ